MKRQSFQPRLIPFSTLIVGIVLITLTLFVSALAFNAYVKALEADQRTIADNFAAALQSEPANADLRAASHAAKQSLFRRSLYVTIISSDRRATIYYPLSDMTSLNPTVSVRLRNDPLIIPVHPGWLAQFFVGVANIAGYQLDRKEVGSYEIYVRTNDAVFTKEVSRGLPIFFSSVFIVLILSSFAGNFLNRQAMRPLIDVTNALERVSEGDFSPNFIDPGNQQELGRLARAFNGAVAQVERTFEQREAVTASMRQFISDAGHQLRTPLTVIRGFISVLDGQEAESNSERTHCLTVMRQQCVIMGTMIDNLILLDRWETHDVEEIRNPVDVNQLLEDIVAIQANAHANRKLVFTQVPGDVLYALIAPNELDYAVTNIIDNAIKYTEGAIDVRLDATPSHLVIAITDQGPGMPPSVAEHAFDRFCRGNRRDVEGSGLGLAITKRAVERGHGSISLNTAVETGSRFVIMLPRANIASTSPEVSLTN